MGRGRVTQTIVTRPYFPFPIEPWISGSVSIPVWPLGLRHPTGPSLLAGSKSTGVF
jgi:hypothetical protein